MGAIDLNTFPLVPVRLSKLHLIGPFPESFYRALLKLRGEDGIVPCPIKDLGPMLGVEDPYGPIHMLKPIGLVCTVRSKKSRTGKGLMVFGEETTLSVGGHDPIVKVPEHTAAIVEGGRVHRERYVWFD